MINDNVYWYVLFVRTGAEEKIVDQLKDNLGVEGYTPFIPKKSCVFRRQGKKSVFQKICFPGYVFVESKLPAMEFFGRTFPVVYQIKDAYKFLSYSERGNMALREDERVLLNKIFGVDRHIDISTGFKEGDSVKVLSGALVGNEGLIRRINKSRQEAILSVPMFNSLISVSVGLEVIEKIND